MTPKRETRNPEPGTLNSKRESGFSLVSAIFLLVVIAALGTFAVTLSTTGDGRDGRARLSGGFGGGGVGGIQCGGKSGECSRSVDRLHGRGNGCRGRQPGRILAGNRQL
jgi:hypothetical protein